MNVTFVGVKELRQSMAKITSDAIRKKHRVIILKKNKPLFELRPLSQEDMVLLTFDHEIKQAQESVRRGETYTTEEVCKMLEI
jgi:antitoxin (DNA-binding transcriptional repressor) of toxin-antitoxin stability system